MTWVVLSLMYSFSTHSAQIAATLPQPADVIMAAPRTGVTVRSRVPDNSPFTLNIGGVVYKWDTIGIFMLPGESRVLRIVSSTAESDFDWSATDGTLSGALTKERRYTAPSIPGLYRLRITRGQRTKTVNVFVMIPFRHQETINGYSIGCYPRRSHFSRLSLPPGFIEVNALSMNTWVSPHFRLKDFAVSGNRYIVLRERLIRKLEALIDRMRAAGYSVNRFVVISGYRTPLFNAANGNVENSVHTYGGAADIIVDENRDGAMDDLNRDGKHDVQDGLVLYRIADQLEREQPEFAGGIGYYSANGPHGAFVHVDIRGERARWHN